ncbi:IpaD/SipD/SspD family type III secretion system needle tip protein [Pseudomonas sp. Irchel s3b2]|uniref:IpaD/SipD/SspD family type III secretion system needle tip protein n=1 Tax=Pseudomonas sp. Irchel s3b2 TaxID=2009073 RepID=UPI000BA49A97|nr:IpaD/SipD/SspD family type III secretion system needle tip protein [Pseudomonas sp. Irchel s3b2]
MKIADSTPPGRMPSADFNPVAEPPRPPEMHAEIHAAFSMTQLLERSVKALNRNYENMLKCPTGVAKGLEGGSAEALAQHFTSAEFVEQIQAKRIRSQMWTQQIKQCGMVFTHCLETLPMEQRQQLYDEQNRILGELRRMPVPDEIADGFDARLNSSSDFFDKLLELIDLIKNGYLAGYEHIIAAYSDFFADFNAQITAKLKDWIEGASDGKEVKLNADALRTALNNLLAKYSHPNPLAVLFPKPGSDGASREEAENWRKALGLPASCLKQNADGTYCVVMDTGPLSTMLGSLPAGGTVTWDTARFQAWQTGFNAQEERMKNTLQSFTQKYSNANSYHDNFNKTLSSHLNQFADMLKAMLNF